MRLSCGLMSQAITDPLGEDMGGGEDQERRSVEQRHIRIWARDVVT